MKKPKILSISQEARFLILFAIFFLLVALHQLSCAGSIEKVAVYQQNPGVQIFYHYPDSAWLELQDQSVMCYREGNEIHKYVIKRDSTEVTTFTTGEVKVP